jgi:hypothetical protein
MCSIRMNFASDEFPWNWTRLVSSCEAENAETIKVREIIMIFFFKLEIYIPIRSFNFLKNLKEYKFPIPLNI